MRNPRKWAHVLATEFSGLGPLSYAAELRRRQQKEIAFSEFERGLAERFSHYSPMPLRKRTILWLYENCLEIRVRRLLVDQSGLIAGLEKKYDLDKELTTSQKQLEKFARELSGSSHSSPPVLIQGYSQQVSKTLLKIASALRRWSDAADPTPFKANYRASISTMYRLLKRSYPELTKEHLVEFMYEAFSLVGLTVQPSMEAMAKMISRRSAQLSHSHSRSMKT